MSDPSFVKKVEQNVRDANSLRERKPWLFLILAVVVVGYVAVTVWKIPSLANERDEERKLKEDAIRDRNHAQEMLAPFQAASLKLYTNEPPEKSLRLLAGKMDNLQKLAEDIKRWTGNLPQPHFTLVLKGTS